MDTGSYVRAFSSASRNYFAFPASPREVISPLHFNRGILCVVFNREMAVEGVHMEVPKMRAYF